VWYIGGSFLDVIDAERKGRDIPRNHLVGDCTEGAVERQDFAPFEPNR
jgi:hypothetical protein